MKCKICVWGLLSMIERMFEDIPIEEWLEEDYNKVKNLYDKWQGLAYNNDEFIVEVTTLEEYFDLIDSIYYVTDGECRITGMGRLVIAGDYY